MNGIRYTYEKPYEFLTATREHRQYQPDFHLTEYDIYIEHFALNEEGQAPPGWTTYAQEARWKRELHASHRTALVETYSWQYRKETLESILEQELRDRGVQFNPVPEEELVRKLSKEKLSVLSSLLGTFLNHAKSSNLDHAEILRRVADQRDRKRSQRFLEIFQDVREGYETLLQREKALDFHDLINNAAKVIQNGNWENLFQYVLIDEFQDISNGRMSLARALSKPDLAYFLVGDDWQSIYRFAGSYLGLIHQVDEHLGFSRRESLTRTFRFGDGILAPSTEFIQQNPEQTRRSPTSHNPDQGEGIIVIPADLPETGLHQALKEIEDLRDEHSDCSTTSWVRWTRRSLAATPRPSVISRKPRGSMTAGIYSASSSKVAASCETAHPRQDHSQGIATGDELERSPKRSITARCGSSIGQARNNPGSPRSRPVRLHGTRCREGCCKEHRRAGDKGGRIAGRYNRRVS